MRIFRILNVCFLFGNEKKLTNNCTGVNGKKNTDPTTSKNFNIYNVARAQAIPGVRDRSFWKVQVARLEFKMV